MRRGRAEEEEDIEEEARRELCRPLNINTDNIHADVCLQCRGG